MKSLVACVLFLCCLPLCLGAEVLYKTDNDSLHKEELLEAGGRLLAEYDTFSILSMPDTKIVTPTLATANPAPVASSITDWEDVSYMRQIQLNNGVIHTDSQKNSAQTVKTSSLEEHKHSGMMLVQFVASVKGEWLAELKKTGVRIVSYIPYNAYLVSGTEDQFSSLVKLDLSYIQWTGEYNNKMRIQPAVSTQLAAVDAEDMGTYDVQLFLDAQQNPATVSLLESYSGPDFKRYEIKELKVMNCVVELSAVNVDLIADQPDVISIHLHRDMQLHGERQALVMADKFLSDGTLPLPRTASYLEWLTSKGFTQQQFIDSGFIVDVTDDGFDNGNAVAPGNSEFCVSNNPTAGSRVAYAEIAQSSTGISNPAGAAGHGNLNLSIIGGFNYGTDITNNVDPQGYHYGLGIAPFALLGSTKIFADSGSWGSPDYSAMVAQQYANGARIHSDSWGANTPIYNADSQAFDYLTRDASASVSGNQEMVFVFSAGNAGPSVSSMGSPGTAKNVFTVGGSKNYDVDLDYTDGSAVGPSDADNINDVVCFSSHGPTKDGRIKPDIVAPASHIHGAASQYENYVGDGVSDKYNPEGQTQYAESSGTSHSCPAVSAASALLRQWFINQGYAPPSPAMNKAWIMNSARYLKGEYGNDDLPSNNQGMGATSLATMLDDVPRSFADQQESQLFTESGQEFTFVGEITDTQKVFRVTLAWTDAPGPTTGAAYVNDLDLIVLVDGVPYYGNVYSNDTSVVGGSGDRLNNVESVFLPAGTSGTIEIKVISVNIAGDGVPSNDDELDQDFALVAYNAEVQPKAVGKLLVSPSVPSYFLSFAGNQYIYPETFAYTLSNTGNVDIAWSTFLDTTTFKVEPRDGVLTGSSTQEVRVSIIGDVFSPGQYSDVLTFTDHSSGESVSRVLSLDIRANDFNTEEFTGGVTDLSNQSLVFTKEGTNYTTYINSIDEFYQDLDEATPVAITDDGFYEFALADGKTFPFFSGSYTSLFVCANGRITLGEGSDEYEISLDNHFAIPSIAPMFADLSPQNGTVYVEQLSDRAVVTFHDVPGYNETTTSSFQIECLFDGTIRITYGTIDITRLFITGLSAGLGLSDEFEDSDFSAYQPLHYDLIITAPDDLLFTGISRGELTPSALEFQLKNEGDGLVYWNVCATSSNNWLSVSGDSSGTLNPGATTTVSVTADQRVEGLVEGTVYPGELSFSTPENPIAETIPVLLSYEDSISILPEPTNFLFTKLNSSTYAPETLELVITNRASIPIDWQVSQTDSNQVVQLSSMSGLLPAYQSEILTVKPAAEIINRPNELYSENIIFSNQTTGVASSRQFKVRTAIDTFTQQFSDGGADLAHTSFLFVPKLDNMHYYAAFFNDDVDDFFVDPSSGSSVQLTDDGLAEIEIENPDGIPFYGSRYSSLFINGNGRVSFGAGSAEYSSAYTNHFALASVAPMLADLSPQYGDVYVEEFVDRSVVSYIAVPEFETDSVSSFQIEFFFNGNIRVTYGEVNSSGTFLCGLSRGTGLPEDFIESDLTLYPAYSYDSLTISPAVGYRLTSRKHLEFETTSVEFLLSNVSDEPMIWTAASHEDWVTMIPAFGSLAAGDSALITARVENVVNTFDVGQYINRIEFSNLSSSQKQDSYIRFEMQEGAGQVSITGSLSSLNGQGMAFGSQQVDRSRIESLSIQNTDTQYPVKIENIRINKTGLPVSEEFSMTNKTVLLYADDYMRQGTNSYPYQVLVTNGAVVTVYGSNEVDSFYKDLISHSWDMVIFSSEYYYMPNYAGINDLADALIDYANSGKPIIAGSWCASHWGKGFWEAIGADLSDSVIIQEPMNIVGLDESSLFFEQPRSVSNPILYSLSFFHYYGCPAAVGDSEFATPVATYSTDTDYALLYMENAIYKGFLDSAFADNSGIMDLWYNMIYTLNLHSFEKSLDGNKSLPITVKPGETVEIPIEFRPDAVGNYESELFIALDAYNQTNVNITLTGQGVSPDNITMGYSRWRDQTGDHLMITNKIDVGAISSASIEGVDVKEIVVNSLNHSIEFVFDEINTTNLLDVVYQAKSGEYVLTNFFSYYSEYIYVSPVGLEKNGFNSWANASKTIQEAVDVAKEWALIYVYPSIYTASEFSRVLDQPTASVTNVVILNKQIVLRGINYPIIHGEGVNRPVLLRNGTVIDGMYLIDGMTKTGANYFIENNGGGVWAESHDARVENLTIWNCQAGYYGGGVFGATIKNSIVERCTATYGGGLGYVNAVTNVSVLLCTAEYGGGAADSFIAHSELDSNRASFGGAATDSDMYASIIQKNEAIYGGALFGDNNASLIRNCLLHNNRATGDGGAFYQNPYASTQTSFINCTVVANRNEAENCGGIFDADVMNSIVYGNDGNDVEGSSQTSYSNIGTGTTPAGQGNISADPLFSTNSTYELSAYSPCIDRGSNGYVTTAIDLAGNKRLAHKTVDMGAYELPWFVIDATAQGGGDIVPSGQVAVPRGTNILFSAVPDDHCQFINFTTNGCLASSDHSNFEWLNVSSNQTICALFGEIIITNGMSERWLAGFYPSRTNYDELATMDTDNDGLDSWQEFVALTDPTNEESVFQTFVTISSNNVTVSWLPYNDALRTYSVDGTTDLLTPFITISNALKNGSMNVPVSTDFKFFKTSVAP